MKKLPFDPMKLPIWITFLLLAHTAAAQSAPHSDGLRWEFGMRISDMTFYHTPSVASWGIYSREYRNLDLQAFGLRMLDKGLFLRGNLGIAWNNSSSTRLNPETTLIEAENLNNSLSLLTEIAAGYQFPQSHKPILDRLLVRTGLLLHNSSLIHATAVSRSYNYDLAGAFTGTQETRLNARTHFSFVPAMFLQLECKIWRELRLGIEWSYGPYLGFGKRSDENLSNQNSFESRYFNFYWDTRIQRPVFSIGYAF